MEREGREEKREEKKEVLFGPRVRQQEPVLSRHALSSCCPVLLLC